MGGRSRGSWLACIDTFVCGECLGDFWRCVGMLIDMARVLRRLTGLLDLSRQGFVVFDQSEMMA